MRRQYFGTDGIRGPYGSPCMCETFAVRLGLALGAWLDKRGAARGVPIPLGHDTRASGPSLLSAVARGLEMAGWATETLGVVPTPVVAWRVRDVAAPLGVVITASHNPASDNGIKLFGPGGLKFADADELEIESLIPAEAPAGPEAEPGSQASIGPARADALARYGASLAALLPPDALKGRVLAVDTAHGATCATAPSVLGALGARLLRLGAEPDGGNINAGVGSEHPSSMQDLVRSAGASLGFAFDGDGDRLVLADETGALLDGDELMAILALDAVERRALPGRTLVATVQSNLGLDAALAAVGGRVERTDVGDRHVAARMRELGATLGGESSGHIICGDVSPTGDGLVAALRVLEVLARRATPLSVLRGQLVKFPQVSLAVPVRAKPSFSSLRELPQAMAQAEAALAGGAGRILVRYSGTEPKLRLLVEAREETTARHWLEVLRQAALAELAV